MRNLLQRYANQWLNGNPDDLQQAASVLMEGEVVDEHGCQVRRTKLTNPYNYDGFVQERVGANEEANGTVYTDRLLQWDYDLTRALLKKHFKDTGIDEGGDYWDKRSAATIEGFLRERLTQPALRVILVMEYCNQATGYPVWRIDYWVPGRKQAS